MQKVTIVTHTGCDLSFADAEKYNITLLPDIVIFDETQYRNNIDLLPEEFYERLDNAEHLPTSSHPNPAAFMDAFRNAGTEEIICITNTSKMAGTYNTASLAARLIEEEEGFSSKIYVYDSLQIIEDKMMHVFKEYYQEGDSSRKMTGNVYCVDLSNGFVYKLVSDENGNEILDPI